MLINNLVDKRIEDLNDEQAQAIIGGNRQPNDAEVKFLEEIMGKRGVLF